MRHSATPGKWHWLLATSLTGSVASITVATAAFLDSRRDHWLLTAAMIWFGGGLGPLSLVARGIWRRRALMVFLVATVLELATIASLYLQQRMHDEDTPDTARSILDMFLSVSHGASPRSRAFAVLVYLVAPHLAAAASVAVSAAFESCTVRARVMLAATVIAFVPVAWSALRMPAVVFGLSRGGSRFCQTAA